MPLYIILDFHSTVCYLTIGSWCGEIHFVYQWCTEIFNRLYILGIHASLFYQWLHALLTKIPLNKRVQLLSDKLIVNMTIWTQIKAITFCWRWKRGNQLGGGYEMVCENLTHKIQWEMRRFFVVNLQNGIAKKIN